MPGMKIRYPTDLRFTDFSSFCRARTAEWDGSGDTWTLSDWFMALGGEVGEAMNVAKKMRRVETKLAELRSYMKPHESAHIHQEAELIEQHKTLRAQLADELADVMAYLDIVAWKANIPWPKAIIDKFNAVSDREGLDYHIDYPY